MYVRVGSADIILYYVDKLHGCYASGCFWRNYLITTGHEAHLFFRGDSSVTGLLWALEGIAWDELHLCRSAVALAELASHDPGGNWANRPDNSLTDIFLPWRPHTLASAEKRQAALRTICAEQPEVAWQLLESLLPDQHSTTSGTHEPVWKNIYSEEREKEVTNDEYWEQSQFCAELMVEQADFDITKLASLAENYDRLPYPASEVFRSKLLSKKCLSLLEQERLPIWSKLCALIEHHRSFPKAEWSLGNESLALLEEIANKLAPNSPTLLHRRLFSVSDSYLYEEDDCGQEGQRKLSHARKAAIEEILAEGGIDKVLEFSLNVETPHLVGEVLASFDRLDFDGELLPQLLDRTDQNSWSLVASYAWHRKHLGGWQWFDQINKVHWKPQHISNLLCVMPFNKDAWERATQLLGENEHEYWINTGANIYETDEVEYALVKLLQHNRPDSVINGLSIHLRNKKDINPEFTCKALLALVQSEDHPRRVDSYHIRQIINYLQKNADTDEDKLIQVEWAYVSLLVRHSEGKPVTLESRLASDPSFFCEMIKLAYRGEGIEPDTLKTTEQSRNIANNAYKLLTTWSTVPGTRNGEFNPENFSKWLAKMEESVKVSGHYDIALIRLGNVLLHSPEGPGGLWIHPVIAKAMNTKERSSLRNGFSTSIWNSRGVHTVDPEAKPELALAKKYKERAEAVENAGYMRLATTLREIADSYNRDAESIISRYRKS